MTKILLSESQIKVIINELYSQSLINKLVTKFKQEDPDLWDRKILFYIQRFYNLKDSSAVTEKDITKYSWEDLKLLVDKLQPQEIRNPHIEQDIAVSNSNLIYDQNKLKIYLANTQTACVKYGTGYNFCISSRGHDNRFTEYRFDEDFTIYFVFDEERSKNTFQYKGQQKFEDPKHLSIIMVTRPYRVDAQHLHYEITNANNDVDHTIKTDSWKYVEQYQPKLSGLKDLIIPREDSFAGKLERERYNLIRSFYDDLNTINDEYWDYIDGFTFFKAFVTENMPILQILEEANMYLKNETLYTYTAYDDSNRKRDRVVRTDTLFTKMDEQEYIQKYNALYRQFQSKIVNVDIKPFHLTTENLQYLKLVRHKCHEYLHKLNQLNYQLPKNN